MSSKSYLALAKHGGHTSPVGEMPAGIQRTRGGLTKLARAAVRRVEERYERNKNIIWHPKKD